MSVDAPRRHGQRTDISSSADLTTIQNCTKCFKSVNIVEVVRISRALTIEKCLQFFTIEKKIGIPMFSIGWPLRHCLWYRGIAIMTIFWNSSGFFDIEIKFEKVKK